MIPPHTDMLTITARLTSRSYAVNQRKVKDLLYAAGSRVPKGATER